MKRRILFDDAQNRVQPGSSDRQLLAMASHETRGKAWPKIEGWFVHRLCCSTATNSLFLSGNIKFGLRQVRRVLSFAHRALGDLINNQFSKPGVPQCVNACGFFNGGHANCEPDRLIGD
jgi:hypothetical protein